MTQLFQSYFLGGFECSTHRRRDGRRLDLIESTGHAAFALQDYRALQHHGIHAVRDGARWHLIERSGGQYDWSRFLPMLRATRQADMQPIWDLCHYGWPDDIDIWSSAFVVRFARFAAALARLVRDETQNIPFYCPVNEASFWAWAGGETAVFNPATIRRGMELKCQLVRATLAAIDAIRNVDPRARMVHVDPVIHIAPQGSRDQKDAEHARNAQYEAWDMLAGKLMPDLGGAPGVLDIIGVNYYSNNQWVLGGNTIEPSSSLYRPFREILSETYRRYRRPLFVAETGAEGPGRAPWLRYVCDEVHAARENGTPVGGICVYPVTDYHGWEDDRHCHAGLLGLPDRQGRRLPHSDLAHELAFQQERFAGRKVGFSVASPALLGASA